MEQLNKLLKQRKRRGEILLNQKKLKLIKKSQYVKTYVRNLEEIIVLVLQSKPEQLVVYLCRVCVTCGDEVRA